MTGFLAGLAVSGIALWLYCAIVDAVIEYRWFESRPVRERQP